MARKLFAGKIEIILLISSLIVIMTTVLLVKKSYKPLIILLCFFLIGNGFYFLGETRFNRREYFSEVSVVGRVTDNITEYDFYKQIILDDVKVDGKSEENLKLTIKNCPNSIKVGDIVAFEGKLERSKPFTLNSFNLSEYRNGVGYTSETDYQDIVISDGYIKFDEKVRLAVKEKLYQNMSERNAGISYAVLFGDKSGVDQTIESAYQSSGIIHVLTVSGLHVGFLISLIFFVLKLCRVNKYVRFVATSIFIFFYAYLCGFSPSVLRAGIMAIVLMISKLTMRKYDNLNSLGIAGFAICLFSPLSALDIGFQMSFFCVASIFMISPILTRLLAKVVPYKISSLLALSISAQIGIIPIIASFGANLNIFSILANLIVVPLFSIIYPILFLLSFFSTFLPFLSPLLCIVDYLLIFVNLMASFFGNSFLTLEISSFKTAIAVIYFVIIFVFGRYLMTKPLIKFACLSMLVLVMTITYGLYLIPKQNKDIVAYVGTKTQASVVIENSKGQRLAVGESYMLSRYLTEYNIGDIDGFIALDYLGNEDMEKLSEFGVDSFMGDFNNAENSNFTILKGNTHYSFGDYQIRFVVEENKDLGVSVTFNGHSIFVASCEKIDYNSLVQMGISPELVFAKETENCRENVVTASQLVGDGFSISQNGNMSFYYSNGFWNMRGID